MLSKYGYHPHHPTTVNVSCYVTFGQNDSFMRKMNLSSGITVIATKIWQFATINEVFTVTDRGQEIITEIRRINKSRKGSKLFRYSKGNIWRTN